MSDVMLLVNITNANQLENFFLIFVRVSVLIFLLPGIGSNYISARYKVVVALLLSLCVYLVIFNDTISPYNSSARYFGILVTEALIGAILGVTIQSSLFVLHITGAIIAQSSSIAQILGGMVSNDAQSTVSNILTVAGIAILIIAGFLDNIVLYIVQSYEFLPLYEIPDWKLLIEGGVKIVAGGFTLAFQLSLPFLALSLFYNITLGAINRAMPQLLVSFVGAPAIIAASIALLVITAKPLLIEWLAFVSSVLNGIIHQ